MANPISFRQLGMIDSTGKLFERLILNRMENMCKEEDNEGISAAQFGFRKGLSTHHALKKVEERVRRLFTNYRARENLRHNSARREECVQLC